MKLENIKELTMHIPDIEVLKGMITLFGKISIEQQRIILKTLKENYYRLIVCHLFLNEHVRQNRTFDEQLKLY